VSHHLNHFIFVDVVLCFLKLAGSDNKLSWASLDK
jgi:hypothetical protein